MKLSSWRLVKARYAGRPLDGSGAKVYGGRWNSVGVAMIYTSSSAALAALEVLAHLPASTQISFKLIEIQFEEKLVTTLPLNAFYRDWNKISPPSSLTQKLGDRWVREGRSAILQVPSVHIPLGHSYLLNPTHADFETIEVVSTKDYSFDRRLIDSD